MICVPAGPVILICGEPPTLAGRIVLPSGGRAAQSKYGILQSADAASNRFLKFPGNNVAMYCWRAHSSCYETVTCQRRGPSSHTTLKDESTSFDIPRTEPCTHDAMLERE